MNAQEVAVLGAQRFLRGMSRDQLAVLAKTCRHVVVRAGTPLFEEGATADRFWLIDAGLVTVDVTVPGDRRVVIEILGRGDLLGLSWVQPPYQWRLRAMATQPTQAFEFDAWSVRAACRNDASLGYEFNRRLSAVIMHRLEATRSRLLEMGSPAEVMA
jgi:CRP/FNR family transcriptional regulator, cyclic AMP receptor protein